MFTIVDRYIFKELLSPFFMSLGGLCFIIFTKEMLRVVDLLVSKGVGLFAFFKIIIHLMPSFLVLTLPISCLIASISTFSRLSYDNELVALRSAGINLWRIAAPVLVFSAMAFLLTLFLSKWGQPWSNVSLKGLAVSLIEDQLTLALEGGVFNEPISGMMIYVPDPAGRPGSEAGVFISDNRDPSKPFIIVARSYRILRDSDRKKLGVRLYQGSIHQPSKDVQQYHQVDFVTYDFWMDIPLPTGLGKTERDSYGEIIAKLDKSNWTDPGARRRLMEYYQDLGYPVSCLLLGMLGLPVGIISKRSGRTGGFAIGVVIIIGFYFLSAYGRFLVASLVLSPLVGAWLPDLSVLLVTTILFLRVSQR